MTFSLRTCGLMIALAGAGFAQRPPTLGSDPFRVVPSLKIEPMATDGVTVRVVDEGGVPRPGVDVVVLQSRTMRGDAARKIVNDPVLERFRSDFGARMFAVAAALGERYVTGADGRATVAVDDSARAFVVHRRVVETVVVTERAKEREVEVVLALPPAVEVVVTDTRGRPAQGVPLLVVDAADRYVYRFVDAPIETDRDGRAWLPHPADGAAKDVLAAIGSRALRRVRLDPSIPRIEIRLPPCGLLRVYARGEGLGAERRVTGGSLTIRGVGFGWGGPQRIDAEEVGEDFVTFRWVGVDEPVRVSVQVGGRDAGQTLETTGPGLPGEMKVVRLDGLAAPLERTVRLLGPDRQPLTGETVMWVVTWPGTENLRTRRTDLLGRLSFTVEPEDQRDDLEIVVVHRDAKSGVGGAVRWPFAVLRDATGGDLGDVVLAREPLLIAGRVVDAAGEPLAGVGVRCDADYAIPRDSGHSMSSLGVGDRYAWQSTETDADGRFELRELNPLRPSVRLLVDVDAMQRIESGLDFAPGATGVELVVTAAARLEGSFAAFPDEPRFDGTVDLVAADEVAQSIRRPADRGQFEADGLAPGTYAFVVSLAHGVAPVFRVEGVELVAGETCRDPRLGDIDWTAFMRAIRVTVTDPAGAGLSGVSVIQRIEDEDRWRTNFADALGGGVFGFWAAKDAPVKLVIRHPEYRTVSIEDLGDRRDVALQPRPRLQVLVPNVPELPLWMSLAIRLEPRGGDAGPGVPLLGGLFADAVPVVRGATQLVRPDLDGAARLVLDVRLDWDALSRINRAGARVQAEYPRDIVVRGGAAVQELEVTLTEDEVASLRDIAASIEQILARDR